MSRFPDSSGRRESVQDRYVLYYEFETRGIFTGYVEGHFGAEATKSERDFRAVVDPTLRRYVAEALNTAA